MPRSSADPNSTPEKSAADSASHVSSEPEDDPKASSSSPPRRAQTTLSGPSLTPGKDFSEITPQVREALAEVVGSAHLLESAVDRLAYNNDCWPRGIILTRGQKVRAYQPSAIVQPGSEKEVIDLVHWARDARIPLIPFGAGSGVCGGAIRRDPQAGPGTVPQLPHSEQPVVVVDLKRLNSIVSLDKKAGYVCCGPGIIGMNLETELNRRGLTLGHYPSSLYCSSVGGYLAARSAGQYSSRYGKMEDMVASLRVVTGTGEVIETAPNPLRPSSRQAIPPVGLDTTQLFVGSEGTLGLITEATLRLSPLPTHRIYRGFQFRGVETAFMAIRQMMQQGLRPAVVRLYDAFDTLLANKKSSGGSEKKETGSPTLLSRLVDSTHHLLPGSLNERVSPLKTRVEDAARGLMGRIMGQPLILNSLIDALPDDCLLVLGFEGHTPLIRAEAEAAFDVMHRYGIDLGAEPGLHWLENRFSVSYKQSPLFDMGMFVDTMEVSTTWDNLETLYAKVRKALSPHVLVMAHFSHVYPEGSSIYFTFAGFGQDLDDTLTRYETTWREGLDAVAQAGGSIAHHHGVGQSKSAWTHYDHLGGRPLFEALKRTFDPDAILNPGKVYAS